MAYINKILAKFYFYFDQTNSLNTLMKKFILFQHLTKVEAMLAKIKEIPADNPVFDVFYG